MRTLVKCGLVVSTAVATAFGFYGPAQAGQQRGQENPRAGTASAAPAAVSAPVRARALPPYETWIADVTAVADEAKAYLDTRLPDTERGTAIVLDIDNTSLETTYRSGLIDPAVRPILEAAKQAKADGAAVMFVTARPEILRIGTVHNLRSVGYPIDGLYMRGTFDFSPDDVLKTKARTAIEKRGYTIVANIGNNVTDLSGGHAERTFKLPDYGGQLP